MNYEDYKKKILEMVTAAVPEDASVRLQTLPKNNGLLLDAIIINEKKAVIDRLCVCALKRNRQSVYLDSGIVNVNKEASSALNNAGADLISRGGLYIYGYARRSQYGLGLNKISRRERRIAADLFVYGLNHVHALLGKGLQQIDFGL